jgi:SnoaL-like domain
MKTTVLFLLFSVISIAQPESQIAITLDKWHKAATDAKFDAYFSMMTENAIFIGTDATENWNKKNFMVFAKPYFDKGKAWSFSALERHIYLSKDKKMAWFDELLNTKMKICRGSGVMIKIGNDWKIQQYVLSMTIPNENTNEIVKIKTTTEDFLIDKLKKPKN